MSPSPVRLGALLLLAATSVAGCRDVGIVEPDPARPAAPPAPGGVTLQALECRVRMADREVLCEPAAPAGAGDVAPNVVIGGQGVYVQLTSSGNSYNPGTGQFTFQTTLQNLIEQPLGTTDGTTQDPGGIDIYFHSGPTVTGGTGTVAVLPDGFATYTAPGQPYYRYNALLPQNAVSEARTWTMIVPPTVESFTFSVYVYAPVPYPDGYITLNGLLPGASAGLLQPGAELPLVALVKNLVGAEIPGQTVTFGATDPLCAAVSPEGTVTGVRAATCAVTATAGALSGSVALQVTGTTRLWDGSASADWANGENWANGLTPAEVDSVAVPTGVPNFPALTAPVTIAGVGVADGATLTLGAFDLTASADVATGATPGSGIVGGGGGALVLAGPAGAVHGRVPAVRVTGDYALDGDLLLVAPGRVLSGRLRTTSHTVRIVSQ